MSDQSREETTAVSGRQVVMRAAGLVSVAFLLSRLVGLARDIVSKYFLALTLEATAFETAQRIPETIFIIVAGGAIGSAFIPTFSAYFTRDDEPGAWRLFSIIINLTLLVTLVASVVAFLLATPLARLLLADLVQEEPALLAITVRLMRVMLLTPMIFGVSGVVMGTLNARQHFLLPAIAPIIYNLGIIAGAILWPAALGEGKAMGMAVGTVIGACGHVLVQLPGLRQQKARYLPIVTIQDEGVRQVLRLMAPRVLGLSFSQLNLLAMVFLGARVSATAIPALNLAWRIMIMPQGILGQAMGTAAFPTLASLAARNAYAEMRQILNDTLRMLLFLGLPASVLLITLGRPLITLLFERGLFAAEDTTLVAWALVFYALGLIALVSLEVIARAFYALNDTMTPVLAGAIQIGLMLALSYWLSQLVFPRLGWLPLGGLALGQSIANTLEVGLLLWLLRRKMGGLHGRSLLDGGWRMLLAAVITAVIAQFLVMTMAQNGIGVFGQLTVAGLLSGIAYLLVCFLLQVKEIHWLMALTRRIKPR